MSKIKIKYTIDSNNEIISNKVNAIKLKDELKYKENDIKVTYNYKNNILKRENEDFIMEYNFDKEEGSIILKDYNKELKLKIKVINKKISSNNIEIKYNIEEDIISYKVEVLK